MKQVKAIFVILFLLLVVIVAVQNYGPITTPVNFKVNLYFVDYETPDMPLFIVVIISFVIGVIFTGLYGLGEHLRQRREIKSLLKEIEERDKELSSLRNLPVTGEPVPTPLSEDSSKKEDPTPAQSRGKGL